MHCTGQRVCTDVGPPLLLLVCSGFVTQLIGLRQSVDTDRVVSARANIASVYTLLRHHSVLPLRTWPFAGRSVGAAAAVFLVVPALRATTASSNMNFGYCLLS